MVLENSYYQPRNAIMEFERTENPMRGDPRLHKFREWLFSPLHLCIPSIDFVKTREVAKMSVPKINPVSNV